MIQILVFIQYMYCERALEKIKGRIATFRQIQLYNHKVVDIYLLVSHGFIYSDKKGKHSAICSNPSCGLAIDFDCDQDTMKEQLQQVVKDHDQDCQFYKIKGNIVNLGLFNEKGSEIYNQAKTSFKEKGVWLQLKPQQIIMALEIKSQKANKMEINTSFILQQFMHLDVTIQREALVKVNSTVFLTIFGWKWVEQTILGCQFCAQRCQVRDYVSPSQFSLMKVEEGFRFKSSHKSWCCLVDIKKQYWKQILRQAALMSLQILPCSFGRSENQLKLRSIQRKSFQIYEKEIKKLNQLRKKLACKKTELRGKSEWSDSIKKQLQGKINSLQMSLEEQKEITQFFVKKITEKEKK